MANIKLKILLLRIIGIVYCQEHNSPFDPSRTLNLRRRESIPLHQLHENQPPPVPQRRFYRDDDINYRRTKSYFERKYESQAALDSQESMRDSIRETQRDSHKETQREIYKDILRENHKDALRDHKETQRDNYKETPRDTYKESLKDPRDSPKDTTRDTLNEEKKAQLDKFRRELRWLTINTDEGIGIGI